MVTTCYNGLLLGSLLDKPIYYWIYHIEPFKPGLGSYAAVGCVGPDETSFTPSGWEWIVSLFWLHMARGIKPAIDHFGVSRAPGFWTFSDQNLQDQWDRKTFRITQETWLDMNETRGMNMMEVCCRWFWGFPKQVSLQPGSHRSSHKTWYPWNMVDLYNLYETLTPCSHLLDIRWY